MSANHKNQHVRCSTPEEFRAVADEFKNYVGRDVILNEAKLEVIVLAMPRKYKRKTELENRIRRQRQDRNDSYSIPSEEDYSEYGNRY